MKISAFIRGYNQLVQAANLGVGLAESSDVLAPVLDVRTMLEASHRRLITSTAPLTAISILLATVPQGEIWRLKGIGVIVSCGVGVTATDVYLAYRPGPPVPLWLQPLCDEKSVAASREGALFAVGMMDELILAGDAIVLEAGAVTGAPTYSATIVYDRIQV